jgi:S-methylmethionine-dependent homocysteine/selenocysteine methylase
MRKQSFQDCFIKDKLILTEGAVGQRIEREFHIKPDKDVMYAGLIYDEQSRKALETIYRQYLQVAEDNSLPIMLLTNTRRANKDRVARSVYSNKDIMGDFTAFLAGLAAEYSCKAYIGGQMGCRGDAYKGDEGLSTQEAIEFHTWQANEFRANPPDFLFAGIMPCLPEAVGMAQVMEGLDIPYIISLMLNRKGTLLDGHFIHDAICAIDAATTRKPICYMTNCVHPSILREALSQPENRTELVRKRFCGIQANAACLEPDQLDSSEELKTSGAEELARHFVELHREFPMKIYGGCCGTDNTHLNEIALQLVNLNNRLY